MNQLPEHWQGPDKIEALIEVIDGCYTNQSDGEGLLAMRRPNLRVIQHGLGGTSLTDMDMIVEADKHSELNRLEQGIRVTEGLTLNWFLTNLKRSGEEMKKKLDLS